MHIVRVKIFIKLILVYISGSQSFEIFPKMPFMRLPVLCCFLNNWNRWFSDSGFPDTKLEPKVIGFTEKIKEPDLPVI